MENLYSVTIKHEQPELRIALCRGTERFAKDLIKKMEKTFADEVKAFQTYSSYAEIKNSATLKILQRAVIAFAKEYYATDFEILKYTSIPAKFL